MEPFDTHSDQNVPRPPQMPVATPPPMILAQSPQTQTLDTISEDDRTMGMLIHLLAILTGFIGVLILWLIKKDESRFVDYHGKEALNFMLSLLIYSLGLMALMMVVGVLTLGFGFFILFPVYFALIIGSLVLEIMACLAAYRGEWHRYPLALRIIH
jgi:uncharacterized Tic20 family protein